MTNRVRLVATLLIILFIPLDCLPQVGEATAPDVAVRRSIGDLNEQEIDDLRKGVARMQSRPEHDPTSWIYQANIHHLHCQHGSWFFLPWHRMYLYYMEKVLREAVREATGDSNRNFTLPYWNYSLLGDSGRDARRLPKPYREPVTSTNVLYVSERDPALNGGFPLDDSAVLLDSLHFREFSSAPGNGRSFGGQRAGPGHARSPHSEFEMTPHDTIHTNIGGWMGRFRTAALDPLFWLHHANIDRLWERWLSLGDGRTNPSGAQGAAWLEQSFEFYDVDSEDFVTMTGADILDTVRQLGYRYDSLDGEMRRIPEPSLATGFSLQGSQRVTLVDRDVEIKIGGALVTFNVGVDRWPTESAGELMVQLDVQLDVVPSRHYEVYANLSDGETRHYSSDAYLGNMAFFGVEPEETARYQYSLAAMERRLRASDMFSGEVSFTLQRAGPALRGERSEDEETVGWVRWVGITRE